MNLLNAKLDLSSYPQKDILSMALVRGIENSDYNDLLWMLAISIHGSQKYSNMPPGDIPDVLFDEQYVKGLPIDVLINMVHFLDWPDITHLCQTSKYFNENLCDSEEFWKKLILRKYPGFEISKRNNWFKLAEELREIKLYSESEQLKDALGRRQLDVANILVHYEPNEYTLETLLKHTGKLWFLDIIKLYKGALTWAITEDRRDLITPLIEGGADIDGTTPDGDTPLIAAIEKGAKDIIVALLRAGADVNKYEPLSIASRNGRLEIVEMLLRAGADVNKGNPLHYVKSPEIIEILLKAGADVNKADNSGETPLFKASDPEILEILLKAGANVNKTNNSGDTPLHVAAEWGNLETAKILLKAGADKDKKNIYNWTPANVASRNLNFEIVDLLEDISD